MVEPVTSVVSAVASVVSAGIEVTNGLAAPIGRYFSYLCNYKTHSESLQQQVEKLRELRDSVGHRVHEATRNAEEIEQQVQTWLTSADHLIEARERIIEEEEQAAKSKCFKGLCPNLKARFQFSKNAVRKVKAIAELLEAGQFDRVSYRPIPQEIWIPSTKGYESFESRLSTLKDIQKALSDPNVNMVGVYGMGGIGKTMLAKEIAMKAEKDNLFDEVVRAEVTRTPDVKKIQQEIAEKLGLEFREVTESGRARRLRERLGGEKKIPSDNVSTNIDLGSQVLSTERIQDTMSRKMEAESGRRRELELNREKKILVILDDIWKDLDLETIGIPLGDNNKRCKVLLTARDLNVLSEMNCNNNFPVGILHEEEAWSLFKKTVGDSMENFDLQSIAKDVANECGGLPIAIVTVARALRNKSKYGWSSALQELRRPSERNFTGIQKVAYSSIELSYNHLKDEELKSIFLLCSLVVGDFNSKDWLLYLSMGLGLLQETNTVEEARNRLYHLVSILEASCLLLDSRNDDPGYFSMHDVVRDVALSIASRDRHVFMVSDEIISLKWPSKDTIENCTAISIHNSNICGFTERLECPQLELFRFISQHSSVKIHDNFFAGMAQLKVLEFRRVKLLSLPSSIHLHLVNLRELILYDCILGDIAIVGELRQLEILVLDGSDVEQLPKEIGQLSCLRVLDLGHCYKLKVIPPDVISSLSQLEELYMEECTCIQWDDEQPNTDRRNASLHELKHLSRLTLLNIHIKDAKILPKGLFSEKLKRYQIYIGDEWDWPQKYERRNILKVKFNTNICMEDIMRLKGLEVLYIYEVQGIKNVLHEVDKQGFPDLKELHVQNNPYFLYIMDSTKLASHDQVFPQLESLFLSDLTNLEKICHGRLTAKPFCKLRSIKVENCEKLKNIFSFSSVKSLPQLQTIEVAGCKAMEEIFEFGREDDVNNNETVGNIELGHVHFLTLKSLRRLTTFCSKVKMASMSQESVREDTEVILEEHDTSATLFNEMVMAPNLEALELYAINCEMIWQNQHPLKSSHFQNLARLIVQGCGNLKFLFSSSTVGSFLQLQHFEICECPALKEIVAIEELGEEDRKKIVFPQLNFIKIEDLENLTRFSSAEEYIEFPSLKQLQIKQCPKLKAFVLENASTNLTEKEEKTRMNSVEIQPLFNEIVAFPNLEEMVISHLDDMKMMWHNKKFANNSFGKLKSIKVDGCHKLQTLWPSSMVNRFSSLESLTMSDCASLEDVFGPQELDLEETHFVWPDFQLKLVDVRNCQSLKYIFRASTAKSLLQLEQLDIRSCGVLVEIFAMERGADTSTVSFVFPKLTSLILIGLPKLTTFYPGLHTTEWFALEDLVIDRCEKAKIFVSEVVGFQKTINEDQVDIPAQQSFFMVEKIFPRLEVLLISMKDIMMICDSQFPSRHLFSKLSALHIGHSEAAAFPLGLLEIFPNLETLALFNSSYRELFSYEEAEKHAVSLARIRNLRLNGLSNLKHMWKQDSKLNSILPNLETLDIRRCDYLTSLVPSSVSFQNLTDLEVCSCKRTIHLLTSSTAKSLNQLKQMQVDGCKMMTEIIANEGDEPKDEVVFSKLEYLSLVGLESLTCFCSGNCTLKFPSLETLVVEDCPKMEIFCQGALTTSKLSGIWLEKDQDKRSWEGDLNTTIQQLHKKMVLEVSAIDFEKTCLTKCPAMLSRFQNLERLMVQGCGDFEYLFSPSIVKSFLQLQHLEICKCPNLSEIMAMDDSREEEKSIVFPQLNFLKIEDLQNLTRLCFENSVEFPSLKRLELKQCPAFKAIFMKNMCTFLTASEEVGKRSSAEIQPFFDDKIAFPNLEEMVISHLDELKMIWHDKNNLVHDSFRKLKLIEVANCDKLLTLFSSNMFGSFSRLEFLTVKECSSLEEIFGHQGSNFDEAHSMSEFHLKRMTFTKCQSLKHIFPPSIARRLLQLEGLEIDDCGKLEEMVGKEGGGEPCTVKFVFPKVASLVLTRLPTLTNFYPGVHTFEWPMLETLVVYDCERFKVFASEFLSFENTYDEAKLDFLAQQRPLFLVEEISPNLKTVGLSGQEITKIWHGQFPGPGDLFTKLETLGIQYDRSVVFPLGFLEKFCNVYDLKLFSGSYKVLFSHEDVQKHVGSLARIKRLYLFGLSDLRHMWKQNSTLNPILQHLEAVEVICCDSLITLVPPSASFQNLTTLTVCHCKGMMNLVTSSTAKSLEGLRKMSIEGCEGMREIVADEEDISAEEAIVFNKLVELSLVDLKSLTSFCSVNYNFSFPSLYVLMVRDCPKMKIFCEGALSTPKLEMVCQNGDDWRLDKGCWESDLNTTIQQLHKKEVLEVSTMDFEKTWLNQFPEMSSRFQNLSRLVVQGCGNVNYLFASSMVKSFLQLQHLEICKCLALEKIIATEELREEELKDIMFPQLKFLKIEDLENLTQFCTEMYIEFSSLKQMHIKSCPKFNVFVLENMSKDLSDGEAVKMSWMEHQPFFNEKVVFPDLEEIVISHLDELKMIWLTNKHARNSFCELKSIDVEGCDKLLTLFPSNMHRKFSRLETLLVNECGSLEEIFGLQPSDLVETYSMPILQLKLMRVTKCQSLKNIFPSSIVKSIWQLEDLRIIDCGILEEIVAKGEGGGGEPSFVNFVFPKVATLVLKNLPALTKFYPGVHTSVWPVLNDLTVYGCGKAKVFASELLNFEKTNDSNLDMPAQQSFFSVEKIGPNLKYLGLSGQEVAKMWHAQLPGHLFRKLKLLGIKDDESATFPLGLLEKFCNLEELRLRHVSYKELFSYGDVEKHAGNLAQIKSLLLEGLSNMMHMWKQESKMNSILQNLETLQVEKCDSLINLVPPSTSFHNLTILKVCYCKGMINLVTSLTAKSLKQLREMSIEGCERMAKIVADEGDVAEDEIVFNKLEELSLVKLKNLTSFCSRNHTFSFPSLEVLIVRECPKMKIFCEEALSTPKLEMVCQNEDNWRLDKGFWDSDLNTTIQQLHKKERFEEDSGQLSVHHLE